MCAALPLRSAAAEIKITAGWQLISIPQQYQGIELFDEETCAGCVLFGVEAGSAARVDAGAAAAGRAYWLYAPEDFTIQTPAADTAEPAAMSLTLAPGWNLIATPYDFPISVDDALRVAGKSLPQSSAVRSILYFYGPDTGEYSTQNVLLPWKGYFIYAVHDTQLEFIPQECEIGPVELRIVSAPGPAAGEVGETTLSPGQSLALWAAVYDREGKFLENVEADWSGNGVGPETAFGKSITLSHDDAFLLGLVHASYRNLADDTGVIRISADTGTYIEPFTEETPVVQDPSGAAYVADQILVPVADGVSPSEALAAMLDAGLEPVGMDPDTGMFQARLPAGMTPDQAAAALDGVSTPIPNYVLSIEASLSNPAQTIPPQPDSAWGFIRIGMPDVWSAYHGLTAPIVAVVDSGVDAGHPDLAGRVVAGSSFLASGSSADTSDPNGHGTRVAGVIAGRGDDGTGMSGVCWNCRIMPIKVCDAAGRCPLFSVLNGIGYAARLRVPVINVSLGAEFPSDSPVRDILSRALDNAAGNGALVVAAAGNGNSLGDNFLPAALPGAFSVAATDINDARAPFSNYGDTVDVAAPGDDIYTTDTGGGFSSSSGTSLSAGFVSGLAALMLSVYPEQIPSAVGDIIKSTAVALSTDQPVGALINAPAAMQAMGDRAINPFGDNKPPVISNLTATPAETTAGQYVTLTVTAEDPDGPDPEVQWTAPAGVLHGADTAQAVWDTAGLAPGEYTLFVSVADVLGASDMNVTTVTLTAPEGDPVFEIFPPFPVTTISDSFTFEARLAYPDGSYTVVDADWSVPASYGAIDGTGTFVPLTIGETTVVAGYGGMTAGARIRIYDPRITLNGAERAIEMPPPGQDILNTASGGTWDWWETSAFMTGTVTVQVVFMESNGAIQPNTFNWNPGEKDTAYQEIKDGLDWWEAQEPDAHLSFNVLPYETFSTGYEPTTLAHNQDVYFIDQYLISKNYTTSYGNPVHYWKNKKFNDDLRTAHNTDWAFTIYVVTGNATFSDNWFGYAYRSGPYVMMTYQNDGWGPSRMDLVTAHETGHIFGAGDQYNPACTSCTAQYGYLQVANSNCYLCSGALSIMKGNTLIVDSSAAGQVGWLDTDGDGVLDPVDPDFGGSSSFSISPTAATVSSGTAVDMTATLLNFKGDTIPGATVNFTTTAGSVAPVSDRTGLDGKGETTLATVCDTHAVTASTDGVNDVPATIIGTCSGGVGTTNGDPCDTEWPQYQCNNHKSGESISTVTLPLSKKWEYTTGGVVFSSPAIVNGKVFIGSTDYTFTAIDKNTGVKVWEYHTGNMNGSSPAVDGGAVFFGSSDKKVYALDENTGGKLWDFTTGGRVYSAPAVSSGTVIVGSEDGKMYSLDANTGVKIWEFVTGDIVYSSPVVVDGKVFFGSFDKKVYALDETTGNKLWEYTTGDIVNGSPTVANGKVYIGSLDDKLYALDENTGTKLWEFLAGDIIQTATTVADGKVFFGSNNHKVYSLDETNGTKLWEYETGGAVISAPAVADGKVFVGSHDNKLYVFDETTGVKLWEYTTGGPIQCSPAVADGVVYIGSYDNKLYAFEYDNTPVPPANATATVNCPDVELSWDAAAPADYDRYTVKRATVSGGPYATQATNISTTSWTDPAPGNGTYYYIIIAYKSGNPADFTSDSNEAVAVVNCAVTTNGTACGAEWPTFHCNNHSSGQSDNTIQLPLTKKWEFTTGMQVRGSPSVANGRVYIGSNDHKLYALDKDTGAKIWEFTAVDGIEGAATVANGRVFINARARAFYALDETTGAKIWELTDPDTVYTSARVHDGKVFVGTDKNGGDSYVLALNEATGAQIWSFQPAGGVITVPAVADGMVFVVAGDEKIYGLDETTGAKIWEFTTGHVTWQRDQQNPAVGYGMVYQACGDKILYALDQKTGVEQWRFDLPSDMATTPALADGKLVIGSRDLFALNALTGAKIWEVDPGTWSFEASPIIADGKVFIPWSFSRMQVYDLDDGTKLWEEVFGMFQGIYSSPAIADGVLYFGVDDTKVYAYEYPNSTTNGAACDVEWPNYHCNNHNNGQSLTTVNPPLGLKWMFTSGADIENSPSVSNGKVFFGSDDNKVYALNETTGAKIWEYTTGDWVQMSSPAVSNGKVFIGSTDMSMYALNENTGALIWSFLTGDWVTSSPAVSNGMVYFGSWDNTVYALDENTGANVWDYNLGGGGAIWGAPAVADGIVFIGSDNHNFYAFDQITGALLWDFNAGIGIISSPAVADGMVFVGSYDGTLFARNELTGAPVWQFAAGDTIDVAPAVADNMVFVGSRDNKLYALNELTGAKIWEYTTGDIVSTLPAVANGKVYIASGDGIVYILDEFTGTELGRYDTGGDFLIGGVTIANGVLYVAGDSGNIYALYEEVVTPPTNATATVNCPDVELSWDAAAPADYDRYTVKRATVSGGPYATQATNISTTSWTDPNPGNGTYYYIVHAYKSSNPAYFTSDSNEAQAVVNCSSTFVVPVACGIDWPMLQCNAENSGEGDPSNTKPPYVTKWNTATIGGTNGSVTIKDGVAYATTMSGYVYAFNADTGAILWNTFTGGTYYDFAPAVINGRVFVDNRALDTMYALDAVTGAVMWNQPLANCGTWGASAVGDNDNVYFGCGDYLYALKQTDGSQVWRVSPAGTGSDTRFSEASPALYNGRLYVGSNWFGSSRLFCLDATSGAVVWTGPAETGGLRSAVTLYANKAYYAISGSSPRLAAIDIDTGSLVWASTLHKGAADSSPVVADDVIYVPDWDGYVYAFNADTGAPIWEKHIINDTNIYPPSMAIANGYLFFTQGYGGGRKLRVIDASTGDVAWDTPWSSYGAPAVVNDKVYLTGSSNVACLEPTSITTNGDPCDTDWPHHQCNTHASGESDSTISLPLSKVWDFDTGERIMSSVLVADDRVFAGNWDAKVFAMDKTTGAKLWEHSVGAPPSTIVYDLAYSNNKVIYATTYSPHVRALDAATGGIVWTFSPLTYCYSAPRISGGVVYVACLSDHKLYALDENTGAKLWEHDFGFGTSPYGMALADGMAFVGAFDNKVYAVDASGGGQVWEFTTGGDVQGIPTVANGKVFVGSDDNKLYALDEMTGAKIWDFTTGDDVRGSAAVVGGTVYFGSSDHKVYALNESNGALIWSFTAGTVVHNSPVVVDGKVIVGSSDHKLYILDAATGAKLWEYSTGDAIYYSSPAVADKMVFVGSYDGKVYAFGESPVTTNGAACSNEWPTYKCNNHNSSESDNTIPANLDKKWEFDTGAAVFPGPAVDDAKAYIGNDNGMVYAVNRDTGAKIWEYNVGTRVVSSITETDGKVFFGSQNFNFYALDATTGAKLWEFPTGAWVWSSPTVASDTVYFTSWDHNAYALDVNTGVEQWRYTMGDYSYASPAVADGKVFVSSGDKKIYALQQSTGAKLWEYTTGDVSTSSPTVADGTVYVGSHDNKLYALDENTGAWKWEFLTGHDVVSSPAVVGGKVYFGSTDGKAYALNASTGAKLWEYTTGDMIYSPPAVVDGKVFIGSNDDKLYMLDANTGAKLWEYTTGGDIRRGPAIANGIVYAASYDGKLYAFDPQTTTTTPPQATATLNCPDVELTWSAAAPASYDRYTVYRATTSGGPYTQIATNISGTTYTDEMPGDGFYYYVVEAYQSANPANTTGYSNETYAQVDCAVTLGVTGTCLPLLTWSSATAPLDRYTVRRSDNSGGPWTDIATGLTVTDYIDSTALDGHTYYYTVVSYRSTAPAKKSDAGNEVVLTTDCAPWNLLANSICPDIALEWQPSNGPQFDRYTLFRGTTSGGPYTQVATDITATGYVDSPPSAGQTYYYVVQAYESGNPANTTNYSNEIMVSDFICPYPEPQNLAAVLNCPDITLTWDSVTGASGYNLYRADVSGGPYTQIQGNAVSPYTDTTTTAVNNYYYVVTAFFSNMASNESGYSSEAAITNNCGGPTIPKPPDPVSITAITGGVTLDWIAPTQNTDNSPLTDLAGYKVYRADVSGGPYTWVMDLGTVLTIDDTGLIPGQTYCYVLTALDSEIPQNESAYSMEVCTQPLGNKPYTYDFDCGNKIPPHFSAPTPDGELYRPYEVTTDSAGNFYVANTINNRIEKYDPTCTFVKKWGSAGGLPGYMTEPRGIVYSPVTDRIYVTDNYDRVQAFTTDGAFTGSWYAHSPKSLAVDSSGNLYIASDRNGGTLYTRDSTGAFLSEWRVDDISGVAVSDSGNIFVTGAGQIRQLDNSGAVTASFSGTLTGPTGIHVSPDGRLFVSDISNKRVEIYTQGGTFIDTVGNGGLAPGEFVEPTDVWVISNEEILVVDRQHDRITKFSQK